MHRIHRFVEFPNSNTLELPTKTHRVINNPTRRILSLSDILESGPTTLPEVEVSATMSDKDLDKFRDALARSSDGSGTREEDMVNAIKKIKSLFLYRAVNRRLEQRPTKDGYKSIQGVINGELGHRDLEYLIQIKDHLEQLEDESFKINVEWRIKSTNNGLTNINKYTDFSKLNKKQLKSGYMYIEELRQYKNTNTDDPLTTPQLDIRVEYNEYRKNLGQKIISNPNFKEIYPGYSKLRDSEKKIFWKIILDNPNADQMDLMIKYRNPIEKAVIQTAFPKGGLMEAIKKRGVNVEETIDLIISLVGAVVGAVGIANPTAKLLSKGLSWLHTFSFLYRAIKAAAENDLQRAMEKGFTFIVYTIWNLRSKLLAGVPPSTSGVGGKITEYLTKHKEIAGKNWFWHLLNWFTVGDVAKTFLSGALELALYGFAAGFVMITKPLITGLDSFKNMFTVEWVKSLLEGIGLSEAKVEQFRNVINEFNKTAADFVNKRIAKVTNSPNEVIASSRVGKTTKLATSGEVK